jgi:hypothetical protein
VGDNSHTVSDLGHFSLDCGFLSGFDGGLGFNLDSDLFFSFELLISDGFLEGFFLGLLFCCLFSGNFG